MRSVTMQTAGTTRGPLRRGPLTGAVALLLALAACAGPTQPAGEDDASRSDPAELDGAWELVSGVGPQGAVEPVESHPVTLNVDGERWRGTAACNDYDAVVTLQDDDLAMEGFAATEMACVEDGVMDSEAAYIAAFLEAEAWSLDDGRLLLEGPDTELVFHRRGEAGPTPDGARGT